MNNKDINFIDMNDLEMEQYVQSRWEKLCKFHAGNSLGIEIFNTFKWLEYSKEYAPEIYEEVDTQFKKAIKEGMIAKQHLTN